MTNVIDCMHSCAFVFSSLHRCVPRVSPADKGTWVPQLKLSLEEPKGLVLDGTIRAEMTPGESWPGLAAMLDFPYTPSLPPPAAPGTGCRKVLECSFSGLW